MIDLPGITKIVKDEDDNEQNVEERLKNMTRKYIESHQTTVLAVSAADNDLSNSDAISISREKDKDMERTIGVLTKIDKCEDKDAKEEIKKNLKNQGLQMKHGWFGLKCRSSDEIENGISIKESIEIEAQFFSSTSPYATMSSNLFCTQNLTRKLGEHFNQNMEKELPGIFEKVKQM